jgi:putative transposase
MRYPSDMSKKQWDVVRAALTAPSKRGPKHGRDLRKVVDALLYITHTGCQWQYLPTDLGKSLNGTLTRLLAAVHEQARIDAGRTEALPSMVIIDTHLARGASHGGATFHDRRGPYGMTKGAKRAIAVDITSLPLCARVVPASTTESDATAILMKDLHANGQTDRLTLVLVDRGTSTRKADALTKHYGLEVRRVLWENKPVDPRTGERILKPLPHA